MGVEAVADNGLEDGNKGRFEDAQILTLWLAQWDWRRGWMQTSAEGKLEETSKGRRPGGPSAGFFFVGRKPKCGCTINRMKIRPQMSS
jgi:hypothetical protein